MGYTPWGRKELDTTERLILSLYVIPCVYTLDPNLGPKSFSMTPLVMCSLPSTRKHQQTQVPELPPERWEPLGTMGEMLCRLLHLKL